MTALRSDVAADLGRENARLLTELRIAGDHQAGSAEILRAIASGPGDAERSLHQIAEITARLFDAPSVTLHFAEGDEWGPTIRVGDSSKRIGMEVSAAQLRIGGYNMPGTVLLQNRQLHVPDIDHVDPEIADWPGLPPARAAGTRVMAGTPLRREGNAIGVLIVYRDRPMPFTADELALQQSFADQAVIAIENARLFNELQAKTNDLSEALIHQTGSANILKVIASSPTDVGPVLKAIVESACELCEAYDAVVLLTRTLKDNLEKIVQHGKRADSIVKNMLLHSREGSGIGRRISMRFWMKASISPIMARAPRKRSSIMPCNGTSTRAPARSKCFRRKSPACS